MKINKNRFGIVGVIIVVVVLVASGLAGFYVYTKNSSSVDKQAASYAEDCGTVTVTDATFGQSPYKGCFDAHFSKCESGKIVVDNQASALKGIVNKYEVQSLENGKCLVKWEYVSLPINPTWNNKPVTCAYDNTKDFQTAFGEISNFEGCTGPLMSVINP